jgi:hypothetical protein
MKTLAILISHHHRSRSGLDIADEREHSETNAHPGEQRKTGPDLRTIEPVHKNLDQQETERDTSKEIEAVQGAEEEKRNESDTTHLSVDMSYHLHQ